MAPAHEITEFPHSVIERLGYYVYLLRHPRTRKVFYVGKGRGNRVFAHATAALRTSEPSDKLDAIRAIRADGMQVRYEIIRHGLTEDAALEVEAALIDFLGRRDLMNLVAGHASDDRGRMSVRDIIAKYRAAKVTVKEPSLLIVVNRLYRHNMTDDEIYEITRGDWVLGARRERARFAFTVYHGLVREVFEIQGWSAVPARGKAGRGRNRWRFEGKVAEQMRAEYLGGTVSHYMTQGAQNPVKYVEC